MEEMEKYIKNLSKKLNGFRSRSPVIFGFIVSPLEVQIQFSESLEIKSFKIDFSLSEKEMINEIKEYLRENFYPKLVKTESLFIEPDISELNKLIAKESITFSEAFSQLSKKVEKTTYIIDKVDYNSNKIVIVDENQKDFIYSLNIPCIIFLRKLNTLKKEEDRWNFFKSKGEEIVR